MIKQSSRQLSMNNDVPYVCTVLGISAEDDYNVNSWFSSLHNVRQILNYEYKYNGLNYKSLMNNTLLK